MKRLFYIAVFVSVVAVFFSLLCSAASAADAIVLRYATQMPKTHHLTVADYEFAKTVEEKTGGKVKIEVYPAGQLYKGVSLVKAVMSGAIDMGITYGGALTGPLPMIDVFDIPFLFSDYQMIQQLWAGKVGALIKDAALQKGIVMLSFGAYGDSFCIINSKRPIKSPPDLDGLKIRCNTPMAAESVKVLGASPLMMSSSEVYAALQRGTVDGATTGLGTVVSRKWYEVAKYATITSSSYSVWPVMINKGAWEKLPKEYQEVIRQAALANQQRIIDNVIASDEKNTAAMQEKMAVYTLSAEEKAQWRQKLEKVSDSFVERTGKEGEQIIELIKQ
ncbi:MAG: TRAP transporter substrate-binding protein [Desulfobacterales bacterium]|nr:MAG: TRAP transporter substrate-binding protein [Desulfobacterales bacterium]